VSAGPNHPVYRPFVCRDLALAGPGTGLVNGNGRALGATHRIHDANSAGASELRAPPEGGALERSFPASPDAAGQPRLTLQLYPLARAR
jgi:hypothetical protein